MSKGLPTRKTGAFRMGKGHVYIGKGLVYCPVQDESAPPVTTHSRVKCALCRCTIQSAVNPPIDPGFKMTAKTYNWIKEIANRRGESPFDVIKKMLHQPSADRWIEAFKRFSAGVRRNPVSKNGPVKIYGQTKKIFMRKTEGPYKGQNFVHDFKPGVQQVGFPRGTVIRSPDGRSFRMTTRSVILTGKKDLWRNFPA